MRLGWGRDDGPFFFSCPGRKPHERCERGPILLCMGLFSRFCVWAPRCTAHSVSKTRVNALRGAALRPGHEIVSASRSRRIDPTPMHHALGLRCRYHLFHQTFETADVSGRIDAVAEANDDNMLRWHDHDALAEKPECKERIAWNAHPRAPLGVFVFAAIGPETGAVVGVERSGG